MNKIKKILAVVLAMAMAMAMSIVSLAANGTAAITVNGLASTGTNTVRVLKILEPDVTVTDSGYKFADGITLTGYDTAKAFIDAGVADQKAALAGLDGGTEHTATNRTFTLDVEAGYYAVYITNAAESGDPEIIYNNPMIVSVGYQNATKTETGYDYDATVTTNSTVTAKYTTLPTTKSAEDENKVVSIGSTQTYTITSYIPSEVDNFTLTDVLTGATYQTGTVNVTIQGVEENLAGSTVSYNEAGNMVINLSNYITGNEGKLVTITYDVTVTGTQVGNTVTPGDGSHEYDSATETLYTGAITLTKLGENEATLADAVFNVKASAEADAEALKFTYDVETGRYVYDPIDGTADVTTGNDGTLTVIGLDIGTYYFEEVQAPEGYSINTQDVFATITEANTTAADTLSPATTSMTDTRLASLPSTGGIGTTIFTVAGCLIMIAAAGMFFVSRRKTEN